MQMAHSVPDLLEAKLAALERNAAVRAQPAARRLPSNVCTLARRPRLKAPSVPKWHGPTTGCQMHRSRKNNIHLTESEGRRKRMSRTPRHAG